MEAISIQQPTGKFNRVHIITSYRYKNIFRTNLQENRYILNQIISIQEIGKKIISLSKKPTKTDHIGDVIKISLGSDWYDSIFSNDERMEKSTTFSAPFICY